jgi:hypothetical protein
MVFTEEDAENDGKIKTEAGSAMASTAAKQGGELYQAFLEVCEESGQAPSEVLGDYVVRALNDEGFSEMILNTDVDMRVIKANDLREEDLRFVKQIADEFDLTPDNEPHPIRKLVDQRLAAQGGGPLSNLKRSGNGQDGSDEEVQRLEARLNRMEGMIERIAEDETQPEPDETQEVQSSRKTVDDLFGDEGDDQSSGDVDVETESNSPSTSGTPISTDDGKEADE